MSTVEDDGESSNSEMVDVNEDEAYDASKKEEWKKERALKLGFYPQKEIVYNKVLPYSGIYCIKIFTDLVSIVYFQVMLIKNLQSGLLTSKLIWAEPSP